jgi:hypothetical protein
MNADNDRAWREFLDVLTGQIEPAGASIRIWEAAREQCHESTEDDENWREGSMRDGMRRARRELP